MLGSTGGMGVYLIPALLRLGYCVDAVSLNDAKSGDPRLVYLKADTMDDGYLRVLLKKGYDALVDFILYGTEAFRRRHEIFLKNTDYYIFLSFYASMRTTRTH